MPNPKSLTCYKCGKKYRSSKDKEKYNICEDCFNEYYNSVKIKKRKCHDCGVETYNYRCDKCWEKYRTEYMYQSFNDMYL